VGRILDLTAPSGVYATRLLAEAGHEVIRVESPHGDAVRRQGPFLGGTPDIEDGATHQFFNAGKRSLALDLTCADGREAFARLAATAEAIVASATLPIPESELRAHNPNVVLTLVANDDLPELCAYAKSGLLSITGHPDRTPVLMGGHIIYAATGLWVMIATAAALLVRRTTGAGQTVTVDVQQCFETFMDNAVENYMARGRKIERTGARGSVTALAGALPCSDGFWMLSLYDSADQWRILMDWMGDSVLADDTTLVKYEQRLARRDALLDRIGDWAQAQPKLEIVSEAQRRHIPASPISTALDLAEDAQLIDRGFLVETEHPVHGRMLFPRGALATVWERTMAPAPRLGEANAAILRELGYGEAECTLLFERGAA
jgi:crotonobetainyl-CoA:carnitine CoA-transferase CaiB-like acyl-CoA transferase